MATTYTTLLALMATVVMIVPSGGLISAAGVCLILASAAVSRAIFGRLVKDTVLPELRGGGMISLGLLPRRHRGEYVRDEREVAVRNAAYFEAYRALAVYSIAIWVSWPLFFWLTPSPIAFRVLLLLTMPLLAMAWTLPQAVVLWTEPDVPEEARV